MVARPAFLAALTCTSHRLAAAPSGLLDALCQVKRHWIGALTFRVYKQECERSADGQIATGPTWLHGQSALRLVAVRGLKDRVADSAHEHLSCWNWTSDMPGSDEGIWRDSKHCVGGMEIWPTVQVALRFLACLEAA